MTLFLPWLAFDILGVLVEHADMWLKVTLFISTYLAQRVNSGPEVLPIKNSSYYYCWQSFSILPNKHIASTYTSKVTKETNKTIHALPKTIGKTLKVRPSNINPETIPR